MPTYEYQCLECKHNFDIWQEVGSPAPPCENCQSPTKKVFQPPRVIFKGSGFYLTDLRSEQAAKSGKSNGEAKESSSEKSESSGEAKSNNETKSDATTTKSETKSDSTAAKSDAK